MGLGPTPSGRSLNDRPPWPIKWRDRSCTFDRQLCGVNARKEEIRRNVSARSEVALSFVGAQMVRVE